MLCPKCHYQRREADASLPEGVCPACGIAYEKWLARQAREARERQEAGARAAAGTWLGQPVQAGMRDGPAERQGTQGAQRAQDLQPGQADAAPNGAQKDSEDDRAAQEPGLAMRLLRHFLFVPSDRHESAFWAHSLLYVVFVAWGWSFILGGIDWQSINGSFLHAADLAFHEFGHVAFSGFGRFMSILGGSLFQVLLPLGLLLAFALWQRDNFAASLMLWWCGQNFIDVSPYIADAEARIMPLVHGLGPEAHDWGNLLRMAGSLDSATTLASLCFATGALLILLSNAWGAALLLIELRGRGVIGPLEEEQEPLS